ncbi:MAG: peptide deformylase [Patescibacteria group bacterium]
MIRKILGTKDPKISQVCKKVKSIDKKVISIAKDLKETLRVQKDPEGVGLAAPQIGENLRIFAMNDNGKIRVIINPEILEISKEKTAKPKQQEKEIMEGCLSLPNYYGPLKRPQKVKIKYLEINGTYKEEEFKGLSAQIVQHEIDHLNGIVFVHRLLEQKQPLYQLEKDEWVEIELI